RRGAVFLVAGLERHQVAQIVVVEERRSFEAREHVVEDATSSKLEVNWISKILRRPFDCMAVCRMGTALVYGVLRHSPERESEADGGPRNEQRRQGEEQG